MSGSTPLNPIDYPQIPISSKMSLQHGFIECEKTIFKSLFLAVKKSPDNISHLVTRCFNGGNFASPPIHIKLLFRTSHQECSITIVAGNRNIDADVL
jgi:hypothetical protein